MLMQPTLEKLYAMKLMGMAQAIRLQVENPETAQLSFEERLAMLVDQQWDWRQNKALTRRLKNARFKLEASIEDIDYRHPRRLDRPLIRSLSGCDWVTQHNNLIITGPCGVGKSYLACALAQKAVRDGYAALYTRAPRLLNDLAVARADGSFPKLLDRIARIDVLVVDDWAMAPLSDSERRDFLEICDDRYRTRSTILTSQVTEAIHFGNDVHSQRRTVSGTGSFASEWWMLSARNHWWDSPEYAAAFAKLAEQLVGTDELIGAAVAGITSKLGSSVHSFT